MNMPHGKENNHHEVNSDQTCTFLVGNEKIEKCDVCKKRECKYSAVIKLANEKIENMSYVDYLDYEEHMDYYAYMRNKFLCVCMVVMENEIKVEKNVHNTGKTCIDTYIINRWPGYVGSFQKYFEEL